MHFCEKTVLQYLTSHGLLDNPFALALSGGSDSMTLYEVLKKIKKPALVIHINHGMRKESEEEAKKLKVLFERDHISYEIVKIDDFDFSKGNIEDRLRKKRQEIYDSLLKKHNIQNLITGHQKNDAEENIFKRILEGASLFKIANFLKIKKQTSYSVFRPMLLISKDEILNYIKENRISYFDDLTNYDTRFLRSKMRLEIFPSLAEKFGKSITNKFFELGTDINEIDEYLSQKLSFHMNKMKRGKHGILFPRADLDRFELKWIVTKLFEEEQVLATRDQIKLIVEAYFKRESNKRFIFKSHELYIEKTGFFLLHQMDFKVRSSLEMDQQVLGSIEDFWTGSLWRAKKESIPYFIRSKVENSQRSDKLLTIQFE